MSDPRPRPKETPATLFGALLMAVGSLMVVLCGLCSAFATLALVAMSLSPGAISDVSSTIANVGGSLLMVAIIGGIPIVMGVLLFRVGMNLRRGLKAGRDPDRRG